MPKALIITTAGINCDRELDLAFQCAGARTQSLHLNTLMADPARLDEFDLIGLPGGFSYGDAVAAGRIAAHLIRRTLYQSLVRAVQRGVPIIAPCNGFQIAVQIGLLPGPAPGEPWPSEPSTPTVTLLPNDSARFVDRWTHIAIPPDTRCIWTQNLTLNEHADLLPVAHGEGRFAASSPDEIARLAEQGQIAVRYARDDNPNGSTDHIAGVCDATGRVLGLMPHPERYTKWTHHPYWTRLDPHTRHVDPPGLQMFKNAVAHAQRLAAV